MSSQSQKRIFRAPNCDLTHDESPIAQWLEHPTSIWNVMGSTPIANSKNSFPEKFDSRLLFHLLQFYNVFEKTMTSLLVRWITSCHTL